ncbi:hypothetical protein IGI04_006648 [Brassica rapa subsp. trilocularis]|uniref:Uncharacterized protein n=1 Tax=Brassica rapa subsp. trilocularis TaxID=1813537 RepID=A0ABQ7NHJ0_BRACM|nr:hypothetical protein IGI04_006648 [Brassica rapa subsp. trilocularis]
MAFTLLNDLRAGRGSNTAEVRLLRLWEARNINKGGELMSLEKEKKPQKDANVEKKPQLSLVKEEEYKNIIGFHGENLGPKHHSFFSFLFVTQLPGQKLLEEHPQHFDRQDAYEYMVASGTKKQVASKRVITMEDTSKMNGESQEATQPTLINKPFVCVVSSGEKRPLTVPKGPNFHCIHVPKSCCTNRVALLV